MIMRERNILKQARETQLAKPTWKQSLKPKPKIKKNKPTDKNQPSENNGTAE